MAEVAKLVNNADASNPTPPTATFAKSLPNISKIEVFTDSFILKYTAEDVVRQRFIIANYYCWTMNKEKDIKVQISEYHKLLEDLKIENISMPDEFDSELLIEKLPKS
ncbi:hypothetical protein GYH30_044262 [Glycine max]|uniref:Uncharacterized protein n=1 Tax=Glycine max TaxID=3847 RepID=A0A0R0FYQ1_SOYBN|nr:hypothetical protein GYH30_044262 [Glycine max]